MSEFAQESGCADRDGKLAEAITQLSEAWQPHAAKSKDEETMQLYLTQQHCLRAVMSQFLDKRTDWRWCMEGEDEPCAVCPEAHPDQRPADLELCLPRPSSPPREIVDSDADTESEDGGELVVGQEMAYTGSGEVRRQAMIHGETLRRFETDLEIMRACCLLCRVGSRPFDHSATSCGRRWPWIHAKKMALQSCKQEGKRSMEDYAACSCGICRRGSAVEQIRTFRTR